MPVVSYSERLEDVMLYRVLRHVPVGFYVDVGANHPQLISVTKLFYDLGWRGINVEPCPSWFTALVDARPRDVNIRAAAGATRGETEFHEILDSGLSTVVERFALRHEAKGFERRTYTVETRTLADICAEHARGEIHFLKIDVEGAEHAVLQGCDFRRYRPWVVVVEATEPLSDIPSYAAWEPLLLGSGYELAAIDEVNRFYVAREHAELRARFAVAVDDYERASSVEARMELAAIKASRPWRLLERTRRMARRLIGALDAASNRLCGFRSRPRRWGVRELLGVIVSIGRELSASRPRSDSREWPRDRTNAQHAALIPKIIWQTYKTQQLPWPARLCALTWAARNRGYVIHRCDDAALDAFFATQPPHVRDFYRALPLGVMKADLWRICVLYEHGGIYTDIDSVCLRPVDEWFAECGQDAELVLGLEDREHLCNWTLLARPRSPMLAHIRDSMVRNFETNGIDTRDEHFVHATTGPRALTRAVARFFRVDEHTSAQELLELYRKGGIDHGGLKIYDESYMNGRWVQNLYGSQSFGCGYDSWISQRSSLVKRSIGPGTPTRPSVDDTRMP